VDAYVTAIERDSWTPPDPAPAEEPLFSPGVTFPPAVPPTRAPQDPPAEQADVSGVPTIESL
jgi:hypothetical protein